MTCTTGSNFTPIAARTANGGFTASLDAPIEIVNTELKDNIIVYPNPTTGNVVIALSENIKTTTLIKVYDMKGQLVASYRTQDGEYQTIIDLTAQPSGLYIFHIESESGETLTKKIVKQ